MKRLPNIASGHFTGAAQGAGNDHLHAGAMARSAAQRAAIAKSLQGSPDPAMPAPAPQPAPAMPAPGGFKAHIIGHLAKHGHQAGHDHVHAAIDGMHQAGQISGNQAAALKAHNGPLVGPQGAATQMAIMSKMLGR